MGAKRAKKAFEVPFRGNPTAIRPAWLTGRKRLILRHFSVRINLLGKARGTRLPAFRALLPPQRAIILNGKR